MKRTTIALPDELATAVEREARRRRISRSEVVLEALAAHMGLVGDGPRPLPFARLAASGHRSTARDFEDVFAAEWTRDRGR